MVQCEAITNKETQCSFNALPNSKYCGRHRYYHKRKSIYEIKHEELKEIVRGSKKKSIRNAIIIAAITMFIGFGMSYYFFLEEVKNSIELSEKSFSDTLKLTESSLNKTFLMTSPVILQVNDTVNETEGRWYINVTNTHPLKETGAIYLYRLEKNPVKPHMLVEEGLKPGESKLFSLTFDMKEESVEFNQKKMPYGFEWIPPAVKTYYVNEHVSITYKITCDNCPSQGIIRRLPDFSRIVFRTALTKKGVSNIEIPTYEWTDYHLEDILKNKTIENS